MYTGDRVFEGLTDVEMDELEALAMEIYYSGQDLEYADVGSPVWEYRREVFADMASIVFREVEAQFYYRPGRKYPFECYALITYKSGVVSKSLRTSNVSYWDAFRLALTSNVAALCDD